MKNNYILKTKTTGYFNWKKKLKRLQISCKTYGVSTDHFRRFCGDRETDSTVRRQLGSIYVNSDSTVLHLGSYP